MFSFFMITLLIFLVILVDSFEVYSDKCHLFNNNKPYKLSYLIADITLKVVCSLATISILGGGVCLVIYFVAEVLTNLIINVPNMGVFYDNLQTIEHTLLPASMWLIMIIIGLFRVAKSLITINH